MTSTPCGDCGTRDTLYSWKGVVYCTSCAVARATDCERTVTESVERMTKIAELGMASAQSGAGSVLRVIKGGREVGAFMERRMSALREMMASLENERYQRALASPMTADRALALALGDCHDSFNMSVVHTFGYHELEGIIGQARELLDGSMVELFAAACHNRELCMTLSDGLAWSVLDPQFEPSEFLVPPHRDKLATLPVAAVILGLSRLAELSHTLLSGSPPPDKFGEAERAAYLELEEANTRRANRAWHRVSELVDNLPLQEDRAEELVALWLLHPVEASTAKFLRLVYRSYVMGHFPEAVILCRAALERSVRAVTNDAAALPEIGAL